MGKDDVSPHRFFLGRQPILDERLEIVGYELLFRSADTENSNYESQDYASVSVISSVLSGFGLREVVGGKFGYINVTEEVLQSDMIEVLPREQTVLELLESIPLNARNCRRARDLRDKGFRIALDDHIYSPEHAEFYHFTDIVKIDILQSSAEQLTAMTNDLKQFPVTLLAECVETREQFNDCVNMGFKLFQGYFFERPVVLKRKGLESSKVAMLKLLDCLQGDMEIHEVETIFRSYPDLSYNLLRLVNSVRSNLREKIKGLRHAIMMLGLERLRRWVQLAIFASSDQRGINNPLLEMAAVRGRLMEYLLMQRYSLTESDEYVEAAFMTGILSLLDVLFEIPMEEIVGEFCLSNIVTSALLSREGELGGLLALAETLEMVNFGEVQRMVEATDIPLEQLLKAQMAAYDWRSRL